MKVEIIKESKSIKESVSSGKYSLNFGHWRTGNGKSFNSERELIEFLEDNYVENGTIVTQSQNVTDKFSKYFQHPPKDAHVSKEFFDRGYELIVGEGESGPSTSNKTIDNPSKPITESNNTEFQIPPTNSEIILPISKESEIRPLLKSKGFQKVIRVNKGVGFNNEYYGYSNKSPQESDIIVHVYKSKNDNEGWILHSEMNSKELDESTSHTDMFIDCLNDMYQEDCEQNDDPEYDIEPSAGSKYTMYIDSLKELAAEFDSIFDNLSHTIVSRIDELVDEGYSYKEIIDSLIAEAKKESKELNEDISETPIEDIEEFITEVKERFPGSEAVYDGDTNTIVITLDNKPEEI